MDKCQFLVSTISTILILFCADIATGYQLLTETPDATFSKCCSTETHLKPKTIKDACHFPPAHDIPSVEQLDLGENFAAYIGCFANHKDNKDCCAKHGMDEKPYILCQNLCDGAHPPVDPVPEYVICVKNETVRLAIASCNKAAFSFSGPRKTEIEWRESLDLILFNREK